MLRFYATTVLIWAMILQSCLAVTKQGIFDNGWLDDVKKRNDLGPITSLFAIASIPIVRAIAAVMLFYMASTKKTDK